VFFKFIPHWYATRDALPGEVHRMYQNTVIDGCAAKVAAIFNRGNWRSTETCGHAICINITLPTNFDHPN
jgi:hypothetical protein